MTKREVIEAVVQQLPRRPLREAERLVNAVFTSMSEALAKGERIELRGFGSFLVRQRAPRVGHNPRTGTPVTVAAKNVPVFKASKELRARVAGTQPSASGRVTSNDEDKDRDENDERTS